MTVRWVDYDTSVDAVGENRRCPGLISDSYVCGHGGRPVSGCQG